MTHQQEKLSANMTPRQDSTDDKHDDNDNDKVLDANYNDKKKSASPKAATVHPLRNLDLTNYGAIRKLSPDKFLPDTPVSDLPTPVNEDAETTEFWSKLRCGSLRVEEVAEREKQKAERMKNRQNRCADYPGLAFGSAMFGSDTTMKFNIIKNELHNIMRSQLKRVDGEVNALSSRVKQLDKNLEESESYIRKATAALAECVALQIEESKSQNEDQESESHLSAFDQHVIYLESQLKEAKIKASQSFQILEDCDQAQESLISLSTGPPTVAQPAQPAQPCPANQNLLQPKIIVNKSVETLVKPKLNNMEENIANGNVTDDVTNGNNPVLPNLYFANGNIDKSLMNANDTNGKQSVSGSVKNAKSIIETEANNNNNNNDLNSTGNVNCLRKLLTREDSANANLPL